MPGMGLVSAMLDQQIGKPARESRLGLIVGLAIALVAGIIWLYVRFPRTALFLTGLAYMILLAGVWAPLQLLAILALVLAVWRWRWPDSFRAHVIPAVRAWLVRWWRYAPRWAILCNRHGLLAHDRRYLHHGWPGHGGPGIEPVVEHAKLVKVDWTPSVDRLLVKLPAGLAPADVEKAADAFAHATRSHACRVRPDRPGRVWVELLRRDPLVKPVYALAIPKTPDLARVPVGKREDGGTWTLPVLGTHVLVAGSTGSGKGSVMWSLLRGLAPGIADGSVEVWGFDPKGGMELSLGEPLFARMFTHEPAQMAEALEDCAALMFNRARHLAGHTRLHKPTPDEPLRLVLIDELAALTALCDRNTATRVGHALGLLLTQGRAVGCSVAAFIQDPGKDVIAYRNLFPTRVALRLAEAVEADMVLGAGARSRGAFADLIDPNRPGVGYVRHDNRPDPIRVRAAYCTDAHIQVMAAEYAFGSRRHVRTSTAPRVDLTKPTITAAREAA